MELPVVIRCTPKNIKDLNTLLKKEVLFFSWYQTLEKDTEILEITHGTEKSFVYFRIEDGSKVLTSNPYNIKNKVIREVLLAWLEAFTITKRTHSQIKYEIDYYLMDLNYSIEKNDVEGMKLAKGKLKELHAELYKHTK